MIAPALGIQYALWMARENWVNALKWTEAARNVETDSKGDWYRDPWGWPEYAYLLDGHLDIAAQRATSKGAKRVARIDVPKGNFATRPAVVLEPLDRLLCQALVDVISVKLIGDLKGWVFGWRLNRKQSQRQVGRYRPNNIEWDIYRAYLKALVEKFDCGLKTDIVSCFASIPINRAIESIVNRAGKNKITDRLSDMLRQFDQVPGRSGIPQRSLASCVIANLYLSKIDDILYEYSAKRTSRSRKVAAARWMDDMWVFGSDEARLRSIQLDIQEAAREAGLELNLGKTDVLEDEDLATEALRLEHSAVDDALVGDSPDVEPLEQLIDRLTDDPVNADRTSIHFAMTRMRLHRVESRLPSLIDSAKKMPQGADHLARMFRDFGVWSDLQDWYLEYEKSDWAKIRWSVGQYGTMFPTKAKVDRGVIDRFAEILASRPTLPEFALAAQRLASWDQDVAKTCLRSLEKRADHPLERRIIGLASLAVRDESDFVRRVLGEYEENQLTLAAIEARSYRPFNPVPDFSADG